MTTQLHFIIGIGRSGTTLLTSILNQHKNVLAAPENYFLLFFGHEFLHKKVFSQEDIEKILLFNRLFGQMQPYIGWQYDESNLRQELTSLRNSNYKKIAEIIYRNFKIEGKPDQNIFHIVDKNPAYSLQAEKLSQWYPSAKFLIAVRDYRANLLSRKQSVNVRRGDTVLNCIRWDLFNKILIRFLKRYPEKCHVIHYEKMVTDSQGSVQSLMQFLELDYSEDLLNFHKRENEKLLNSQFQEMSKNSDRITKKYTDMARPINTSRMEAWKTELDAESIHQADIICGHSGKYFEYEPHSPISNRRWKKLMIYITHPKQVLMAYYDIYKDYILYFAPLKWKINRFETLINRRMKKYANESVQ